MDVPTEPLMLAAEEPASGVQVVRVAGDLNRMTAPRLARLLDDRLGRCIAAPRPPATFDTRAHLIIDLGGVRNFGDGGLSVLSDMQHSSAQADIAVHLAGLTASVGLLPGWVADLVASFDGFPDLEDALSATVRRAGPVTSQHPTR